jgi:hypoxanthine phosphoribosyltransferase
LKGVIFDHSTLLVDPHDTKLVASVRSLLENLKTAGLQLVVFSTNPQDINAALKQQGIPAADHYITKEDVGANKGSPAWVRAAASRMNAQPHELLYVGDDVLDWRTSINAATWYLHAGWIRPTPGGTKSFVASKPEMVWMFVTHFLLALPRWSYTLDIEEHRLHLRSLLGAKVVLPSTDPDGTFTLQDVFTYANKVKVGKESARNLLMLHAITSLYLEGLIVPNSSIAVYPSSKPGKISGVLREFVEPVSWVFHAYFRDLLVRAVAAPDTSLERVKASREGRDPNVSFTTQANTVHVNQKYRNLINGRTVVVFDDFTTTGMSLEWARNLLHAASAARVIMITIGKYPRPHTIYVPTKGVVVTPFELKQYTLNMFGRVQVDMKQDANAPKQIYQSLAMWKEGKPYSNPVAAQGT